MGPITLSGATGGDLNFHVDIKLEPGTECTGTTSPTSLSVAGSSCSTSVAGSSSSTSVAGSSSSTSVASSTKENEIMLRKKSFDSNHLGLPFEYSYNKPAKRKHDSQEITDSSTTGTVAKGIDIDGNGIPATPAFAGPENGSDADRDEDDDSDDSEEGDPEAGVYIVEKIEGKRVVAGVTYYLIKWKGWDASANTWEPFENLGGCNNLLYYFEQREAAKRRKGQKSGASKKRRRTYSDLDDEVEEVRDTERNMKSYGVLLEWPADKEPISVEGVINVDDVLTYVVKKKARLGSSQLDRSNAILVRSEGFRKWFPELIIQFYEKRIVWNEQVKDNDEQADVSSQMALLCKNRCSRMEPEIPSSLTSHKKGSPSSSSQDEEDMLVIQAENVDLDLQAGQE